MRLSATKLHEARKKAGLTQEALAHKIGLHPVQISHYETGRRATSDLGVIVAIAGALGVGDFRKLLEEQAGGTVDDEEAALVNELVLILRKLVHRDEVAA